MQQKIYLDCTHTYYSGLNTGIQRVVKNTVANIKEVSQELETDIVPVIFTNDKYYKFSNFPNKNQIKNSFKILVKNIYIKIRSFIAFILPKRFQALLYAPKINIFLNKIFDTFLFSKKIDSDDEVKLQANDILILMDAIWLHNNYKLLEDFKNTKVNIIAVIYDIIPLSHPQFSTIDLTNAFKDWYKNSNPYIDTYMAISKSVKEDTFNYIKSNIDSNIRYEKFDYFYLGADFKKKDTKNISSKLKHLFTKNNTYLTVSTIEPRKNHKYILDSFDTLWAKGEDVKYVMIGRVGWDSNDLIKRIKNHKEYNKRLFLLIDIDDSGLVYAYKNSRALIFASFTEGFGLPIIESLFYNLPVLASNTPIHKEIGKNSVTYFDLSDHNSLSTIISTKDIKTVDNFKWQNWHQSTEELIKKCIK